MTHEHLQVWSGDEGTGADNVKLTKNKMFFKKVWEDTEHTERRLAV